MMRSLSVSLLAFALSMGAVSPSGALDVETVGTSDPKNDTINPVLGRNVAQLPYSFPNADILSWTLTADRDQKQLIASMTMNGPWYGWVEQLAWGTFPLNGISFTSPALTERCDGCDERFGRRRFVIAFGSTGCHFHELQTVVAIYDPVLKVLEPLAIGSEQPFVISEDQKTVTVTVPYSLGRGGLDPVPHLAVAGETLADVTAVSFIRDGQGLYSSSFCAFAYAEEGATDWSPASAWDPLERRFRTSGISLIA